MKEFQVEVPGLPSRKVICAGYKRSSADGLVTVVFFNTKEPVKCEDSEDIDHYSFADPVCTVVSPTIVITVIDGNA